MVRTCIGIFALAFALTLPVMLVAISQRPEPALDSVIAGGQLCSDSNVASCTGSIGRP
ncbi:MAG: hypothetical protein KDJ16_09980 [Hyphomicrobiales bacterium]|nr:hypothetical protein [Hyphomicrobiales bacterium]